MFTNYFFLAESKELELVFLIDISSLVDSKQLTDISRLIEEYLKQHKIQEKLTRVAVYTYESEGFTELELSAGITLSAIKTSLDGIKGTEYTGNLNKALEFINTDMKIQSRPNVQKILIIFTGENPSILKSSEIIKTTNELEKGGVSLIYTFVNSDGTGLSDIINGIITPQTANLIDVLKTLNVAIQRKIGIFYIFIICRYGLMFNYFYKYS